MAVYFAWADKIPFARILFVVTAVITNPGGFVFNGFYFSVFVFASRNAENFITKHPDNCFSGAFVAAALCFVGLQEPNP